MSRICGDLKADLNTAQNKLVRNDEPERAGDLVNYRVRVAELEEHVRELSKQLSKWTAIRSGPKPPPLSKLVVDRGKSPPKAPMDNLHEPSMRVQSVNEEDSKDGLTLEGVNVEQPGRAINPLAPPRYNTARETASQQRVAQRMKKEASKDKRRIRNYNVKDES